MECENIVYKNMYIYAYICVHTYSWRKAHVHIYIYIYNEEGPNTHVNKKTNPIFSQRYLYIYRQMSIYV